MAQLEICLLGTFQITHTAASVTEFSSNKVRALLAYLVVESDRPHRRDALAGLLWPESDQRAALSSLRNALANLRLVIGDRKASPPYLLISRDAIQFNSDSNYHLDAAELFHHDSRPQADIRRRIAAMECYRGPFLQGFSVPDSAAFEEWASLWRERLERKTLEGLHWLAEYYETRGDITQALVYARRQAVIDPWVEQGHHHIMHLLAISGQREQAIRQYQTLCEILSKNLSVVPSQNTTQLYQEILSGKFPAAQPKAHPPHNLPIQHTSFIGREKEIERLKHIILSGQTRLVTVTGAGGIGKTRLALRAAEELLDAFPHGVWLIELAALSDPELVPAAVASVLKQREHPDKPFLEVLVDYLRSKKALIILDTCEHMVNAVASLADRVLHTSTQVVFLATSREILGVSGELPLLCPNLTLPDPQLLKNLTEMEQYSALISSEAVRLFAERTAQISPGFTITEKDTPILTQVCRRLDGIPLAIELAAARMRTLSVAQIAERLDHVFGLLTGGSRSALPRQQTLKAAIDWSYNLLNPDERELLLRLAVFSGGWTLEAAEAVCPGESSVSIPFFPEDVLNLLGRLADKSLILAEPGDDGKLRYRMLDTIRQYSLERLQQTADDSDLRQRHLIYFIQLAEEAEPHLRGWGMVEWLSRIELEMGNLRLAMEWSLAGSAEQGLRLAVALKWFWHIHNHRFEGIQWLERLLAADSIDRPLQRQPPASRLLRGIALIVAGALNHYYPGLHFEQAQIQWKEGKKIIQELGDLGQKHMPFVTFFTPSTEEEVRTNLALARELGDELYTAELLWVYRNYLLTRGDVNQAEACARENLAIRKKIGDVDGEALALYFMADNEFMKGNPRRAIELMQASQRCFQAVENVEFSLFAFGYQARVALVQGDIQRALQIGEEELAAAQEISSSLILNDALGYLCLANWALKDYDRIPTMCEERIGPDWEHNLHYRHGTLLYVLGRIALSQGEYDRACDFLKQLNTIAIPERFLAFQALGIIAAAQEDYRRAAVLFGALEQRFHWLKNVSCPAERDEYEQALASVRTALGEEFFFRRLGGRPGAAPGADQSISASVRFTSKKLISYQTSGVNKNGSLSFRQIKQIARQIKPAGWSTKRRSKMIRSIPTLKRIGLPILAVALVVVVSIVAYALNNRPQILPTGNTEPVALAASINKTIELGSGHRLVLNGAEGKIIAPETIIKYSPKTLDIGAGYKLVIDASGGQIIPPTRPNTSVKRTELGAGYVLVETAYGAWIAAPATAPKAHPTVQKTYLGAGYWLINGPDGGRIVPPQQPGTGSGSGSEKDGFGRRILAGDRPRWWPGSQRRIEVS